MRFGRSLSNWIPAGKEEQPETLAPRGRPGGSVSVPAAIFQATRANCFTSRGLGSPTCTPDSPPQGHPETDCHHTPPSEPSVKLENRLVSGGEPQPEGEQPLTVSWPG